MTAITDPTPVLVTNESNRFIIERQMEDGNWGTAENCLSPQPKRLQWYRDTYPDARFRLVQEVFITSTRRTVIDA